MRATPFFENSNVNISLEDALVMPISDGVYQAQFMKSVSFNCISCQIRTKNGRYETGFFKDMPVDLSLIFEFRLNYDSNKSSPYYIDNVRLKNFHVNSLPEIPVWYDMALDDANADAVYDATVKAINDNPQSLNWTLEEKICINYK